MKFRSIFDLVQASEDLLAFFDDVITVEQLVSRLERLKRQSPEDLKECLDILRDAINQTLNDSIELGGTIDEGEETEDDDLAAGLSDLEDETDKDGEILPTTDQNTQTPQT